MLGINPNLTISPVHPQVLIMTSDHAFKEAHSLLCDPKVRTSTLHRKMVMLIQEEASKCNVLQGSHSSAPKLSKIELCLQPSQPHPGNKKEWRG